jgi:hypothetical protein
VRGSNSNSYKKYAMVKPTKHLIVHISHCRIPLNRSKKKKEGRGKERERKEGNMEGKEGKEGKEGRGRGREIKEGRCYSYSGGEEEGREDC